MEMNCRTYRRASGPDRDADLRVRLRELAEERRRFGSPRLHILLRREGVAVNHKRVSHLRVVQPGPTGPNQHWAMNFGSDWLENGRRFRMLTVANLFDRRSPVIEADHSLTGERVARALERLSAVG